MPYCYVSGRFTFRKENDGIGGAYYTIINNFAAGRTWDSHHWFSSTSEMDEYAKNH